MSMDVSTQAFPRRRLSRLAALGMWCLALAGCAATPRAGQGADTPLRGPQAPQARFRVYAMTHAFASSGEICEDVDPSLPRTEELCWYSVSTRTGFKTKGPLASRQPYAHGKAHGTGEEWYEDGTLKARSTYDQGVRQGPWEQWNPDGTLAEQRFYVDGTPHGEWAGWGAEGRPSWVLHYDMGRPIGEWTDWGYDADGSLQRRLTCQYGGEGQERSVVCERYAGERLTAVERYQDLREWDGADAPGSSYPIAAVRRMREELVRNGSWIEYDEEGHELKHATYGDGVLHGPFQEWYGPEQPKVQGTYANGREHGEWRKWHEDGVMTTRVEWAYGQKHGRFERWYEDGKPAERGAYHHDEKHGFWERWREDGSLVSRGRYERDRAAGAWEEHDEDGSVHRGPYRNDERHGVWTTWDAGGARRAAGPYTNGRKHGLWVEWSPGGHKLAERRYDEAGRLHGAYVDWHEGGGVALRGHYEHGWKQGLWERFEPANAARETAPGAGDAEDAIAPGVYFDNRLFQPVGYQVHGGCGAVFPDAGEPGGQCGLSLVRSHRRTSSSVFWGYGVDMMGEQSAEGSRFNLGPALRVGLMTRSRRRGSAVGKGTYVYTQATPFLTLEQDSLGLGLRLGVGYSSPAFLRGLWKEALDTSPSSYGRDDYSELKPILLSPFALIVSMLSHGEFVYQYDGARGKSIGFLFGLGF